MTENKKLPEPVEITEEMLNKCTCQTYQWLVHPCPYYKDDPNHANSDCNCCPHCLKICADSVTKK